MTSIIEPWTQDQKAAFRQTPQRFAHRLADTGLFNDEALVRLLDRWPHDLYDINLFDFDDEGNVILRTGVRGRQSGDKALEGVKAGRIWIQLRQADRHNRPLRQAIEAAFEGIAAEAGDFLPVNLNAQLILSGPKAQVAYHADAPGVVLFHMRGRKRVFVYPNDEAHVPQTAMENIALKSQTEDLDYRRAMDAQACIFDLEPGEALTWPLHAPHRIENLGEFNVSVSVDFQTWESRLLNGALYTTGLLRRAGLPAPRLESGAGAMRTAPLWAAHLALKRLPLARDRIAGLERSFELSREAA